MNQPGTRNRTASDGTTKAGDRTIARINKVRRTELELLAALAIAYLLKNLSPST